MGHLLTQDHFRAERLLVTGPTPGHRRRRLPSAPSLVIHAIVLTTLLALRPPPPIEEPIVPSRPINVVFYTLPPPPVVVAPEPLRFVEPPRAKPARQPRREPVQPRPALPEPPPPMVARVEPEPAPAPAPPPEPPPAVEAAVFAVSRRPDPVVAPARQIRTAGFGNDPTAAPRAASAPAETATLVGGFGTGPGTGRSPSAARGTVSTAGFGSGAAVPPGPRGSGGGGAVERGGFGDGAVAAAPAARPREKPAPSLDTPVEIVSKPKPIYTADARERRIEGEVVLEVIFVATGELRILRVLAGLGHGLDEAAIAAANQIRFKPARSNGRPIDHTATLRVVFRLA